MTVARGRRGKYFTDVVRKRPLRARLRTLDDVIEGTIHIDPEKRTLDELNEQTGFLAVTEAVIQASGEKISADFIALNKSQIVWVQPLDELGDNDNGN